MKIVRNLFQLHMAMNSADKCQGFPESCKISFRRMLDGVGWRILSCGAIDEAFLDGLGAQRIPDPTTSGDFTRRFEESDILKLMEITNTVRQRVWRQQPRGFLREAFIDTDGTIAPTFGKRKAFHGSFLQRPLVLCPAGGLPDARN